MNAVIYARYSSDSQREESIEGQLRDRYDSAHYKHILKKNGVIVVSAKEHISDGP